MSLHIEDPVRMIFFDLPLLRRWAFSRRSEQGSLVREILYGSICNPLRESHSLQVDCFPAVIGLCTVEMNQYKDVSAKGLET